VSVMPVKGLILSGGYSTRMGRDKGSLPWDEGLLVHHQARRLSGIVDMVYISCREEQLATYHGDFPLLADTLPSGGPMTGLLRAMEEFPETAWLVLSVDLPYLQLSLLLDLMDLAEESYIASVYRQDDGILQPLAGIWYPGAKPLLEAAFDAGYYSLQKVLQNHHARILESPRQADWTNLNTLPRRFEQQRDQKP
jgi:molybdopterin-guanine dinucleotide biosynthesis protein A